MDAAKANVVVVGAGIVGVSTAIWLQRDGHEVTLIDRKPPGEGTSYGNAGVLASSSIVPVTTPGLWKKAPRFLLDPDGPLFLRWGYVPRLLPWLARYMRHCHPDEVRRIAAALTGVVGDSLAEHQVLARDTAAARWIAPSDYVFAYTDRAAYESEAFSWSVRRTHGYTWTEYTDTGAYDPFLGDVSDFVVSCPDHGHITDPSRYVKDLAAHFESSGGTVRQATVNDIIRENGTVVGAATDAGPVPCDRIVIATGVWSKPLMRALGLDVPLESERGYHIELYEPSAMPRGPTQVAAGKFVMTPMDGRLRLAGLVEFGGLDAPASRAPFRLLERAVRRLFPDLTWSHMTEWMGHRPATTDSIPVIGETPDIKGAYVGFGHHHIGLTGGPKTGRMLADLIANRRSNMDLAPYAPARFKRA